MNTNQRAPASRSSYLENGFVLLTELFPAEILMMFYERMKVDLRAAGRPIESFATSGPLLKRQALEVYAYQYVPMLTFLWGLTPRIAKEIGCDLLPTYAYFRIYQQGDVCLVHSDREACEHSLSLTVAYGDNMPWSLCVANGRTDSPRPEVTDDFGDDSFTSHVMRPGDGVLYQGIHHRHGRLDPNPNRWSAHLFMHWVEKNGSYSEQAFDRPALERASRLAYE